jgi:putative DNA primase/helicase
MSALYLLADEQRWLSWRNEQRGDKLTKVPYYAPGRKASSTDPSTWRIRSEAEACAKRVVNGQRGGVGVVLGDLGADLHLCGLDLDSCLHDGAITPWAAAILNVVQTYTEISPSGAGLKCFFFIASEDVRSFLDRLGVERSAWGCRRDVPGEDARNHGPAVEFYASERYFAVTDQRWTDAPEDIYRLDEDELERLAELIPPPGKARTETKTESGKSGRGDTSRSAAAFRKGAALRRAGKSYQEMVATLLADPETADWARTKGQASGGREFRRIWDKADPRDLDGFDLTEDGVALAFAAKFKDRLRYCHHTGAWFEWTGSHWQREETKLAFSWARHTCRELARQQEASNGTATALAKAATAAAVERFAQADRAFAVTSAIWDRDPMLLGTPDGVVDLQTGKLRPAVQGDFITKLTAVAPAETADCPLWIKFLNDATGGDAKLIRFLQQWAGYCLSGDTREQALLFVYGPGGNGKTVWLNTMAGILASYAKNAAMETFTASQNDRHPTELAMLKGARMVCASETEDGRAWAEVRIKQLTGGDTITARFMRQDFFEYQPQFKLTVIGNHKPVLRNVDDAARRRFNVVPFTRKPASPDNQLETKLRAEWPAILHWMIQGCLDWLQNGLIRPKAVVDATANYFSEQDTLRQWLDECCDEGPNETDTMEALFKSWTNYALANGEKPGTTKWFSQAMQRFGFDPVKNTPGHHGKRGFERVGLKPVDTSTQWQNGEDADADDAPRF